LEWHPQQKWEPLQQELHLPEKQPPMNKRNSMSYNMNYTSLELQQELHFPEKQPPRMQG
jgi:hypothetical protein